MDDGFIFLLFCGFILLVMIVYYRSKQKNERAEDRELIRDLTTRIYFLEETVRKLKREGVAKEAPAAEVEVKSPEPVVAPAPRKPEIPAVAVKAPTVAPLKIPAPAKPIESPVTLVEQKPAVPVNPPVTTRPVISIPIPKEPAVPVKERFSSGLDTMEEKLGRNWLGKIGISLVVLAGAAYLGLKVPQLSPMGKVLVGVAVDALLLGGGIWLERKERYRVLARAGIGGGWAFLFFLSWAIYNLDATRIITSAPLDFVLMMSVAVVMVLHTLRYRSQAVTGLAYLLAFLTVGLNHEQVLFIGGLGAGILLVAGLVVIAARYQWFELELIGILASYLNHYLWLKPIIEKLPAPHIPFPEFLSSVGVLILYWLIFRVSYVWRTTTNENQERISTLSALVNPALLLVLLKYQSVHPQWAFWGLLAIGAIETALGQLPITRRRRTAVIVLSTLGVIFLVAAFPLRYSGTNLSVLWLMEAEALLLIGVWTREIVFRRLGLLTALLVSGYMLVVNAYPVYLTRVDSVGKSDFALAVVFAVSAILFYVNELWVARRWSELFSREFDRTLSRGLSYVAALMALIAAWMAFPEAWTTVAWCALAAAMAWAGRRFAIDDLFYQANFLSAAGIVRVTMINLYDTTSYGRVSLRFITVALVATLLYVTAHWSWEFGKPQQSSLWRRIANAGYTWTASFLLALMVWYELREHYFAYVVVVWAAGSLVLAFVGRKLEKADLTYQANAAALIAVVRAIAVNYDATHLLYGVTERLITVALTAVLLYVTSRWSYVEETGEREFIAGSLSFPFGHLIRGAYTWAGSFLLSYLAWYELHPVSVAVAWMIGGLVLLEIGLLCKSLSLRCQAYVALLSAFLRIFFVNLNAGGEGISPRLYTVVPIALALFYAYWRLLESPFQLNRREQQTQVAEFFCWLGTVTVVALVRFELLPDWVATGWAGLALILLAGAYLGRRLFLHQALLLSFGILFRTVMHNFYQRSYFPPANLWQSRWVLVGSTVALMFLSLPFLLRLRRKELGDNSLSSIRRAFAFFDRHPEQVFFFIAVGLLTTMLALETQHGMVTLAWALEGFAVFLLALLAGERSFRLTGLGLLLLCVAKILLKDIWRLQLANAILTTVVLGVALVLVSFLYSRYHEKIAKYL